MHVRLDKAPFLKALAHQQNVVERRTTVPILSHVLLQATFDGRLKMTGTDLELTVEENIPAVVQAEGSATLSAHVLYDIARKLQDGAPITLELDADEHHITLRCPPSQFTLPTLNVADFPIMTEHHPTHTFSLTGGELRRLIDQTRFAMSTEEARYYLNGIYFHPVGGDLRAVATDAHRLALTWIPLPPQTRDLPGAILSRKTIGELRKLLEGDDLMVDVSLSASQMAFQIGGVRLYSRLVQGNFPDYQQAIPPSNQHMIEIDTRAFSAAVDRVSMIASDKDKVRGIKMKIHSEGITFSAHSQEHGFACEDLPITYTGKTMEMGFNARYILDVLQQLKGDTCHLYLGDASLPALVKDPKDEQALYVLMPMRV